MKDYIFKTLKHPLFSGSLVMIVGTNAVSFLNYVYHFVMGRLLGPASYGELVVIISLIGLIGVIPNALGLSIVKQISSVKGEGDVEKIVTWINKKLFKYFLVISVFLAVIIPFFSSFLQISAPLILVLVGLLFLFGLPNAFNRASLQGLLRFPQYIVSNFTETGTKLVLGVLLVLIGWSVMGAVVAFFIASFFAWLITRKFLSKFITNNVADYDIKPLLTYSVPVLIQSLALTSLYSSDLILVKHFFSSYDTGLYASLSTLGKIIFFAAGPVAGVMFPIISQKHSREESFIKTFLMSFIATFAISAAILVVYKFLPTLAIGSLFGSSYLQTTNLLFLFGIFMLLFTLASLLVSFYLSLGKTRITVLPLFAALAQIVGIWFYHHNLQEVIVVSITVSSLLLLSLLIYLPYGTQVSFRNRSNL